MKIEISSVYVDDQDKALKFCTEVLGFVKKTDKSNVFIIKTLSSIIMP